MNRSATATPEDAKTAPPESSASGVPSPAPAPAGPAAKDAAATTPAPTPPASPAPAAAARTPTLLLVVQNPREEAVLKIAFEQTGIAVKLAKPGYHNYVKLLQYLPEVIVIEIPLDSPDHLGFAGLIRSHKKTQKAPIVGYGDKIEKGIRLGYERKGLTAYIERPLQFGRLSLLVNQYLKLTPVEPKDAMTTLEESKKKLGTLLEPTALPMMKIEIIANRVSKLLAFPFSVTKVLKLTHSDSAGATELARAIETDPAISAHLLRVSNSVFFASLNRRIGSIKDSIVRIGFTETKRIVMGMSVMKLFARADKNAGFDRTGFWYHSLAVGVVAERLARNIPGINVEETFLAGLMHDLGIMLFDEFVPEVLDKVLDSAMSQGVRFIDEEKRLMGITHNDVIGDLFPKWKLPDDITQAVLNQHGFDAFADALDTPAKKMALCVGMGDRIAKALGIGKECDQFVDPIGNWAFTQAHLPAGVSAAFVDAVNQQIESYRRFLGLDTREWPSEIKGVNHAELIKVGIYNHAKDLFVPPALYLPKERFSVEAIDTEKPLTNADLKYSMVIMWAGAPLTAEVLKPFAGLLRCSLAGAEANARAEPVPVVVMGDPKTFPGEGTAPANMKFIANNGDLREIDRIISECHIDITTARP